MGIIKKLCTITLVLASCNALANTVIPQPVMPTGSNSFRTSDGMTCSNSASSGSYMESGVFTMPNQYSGNTDTGGYVRVLIPIGGRPKAIDCNRLYDMELKYRKRLQGLYELEKEVFGK